MHETRPWEQLVLILDCRTHWNSLADMLDHHTVLHRPVTQSLIDINPSLIIINKELTLIKQLSSCLKPVRMGVESLCKQDTSLVKADGIWNGMMDQLSKKETPLSLPFSLNRPYHWQCLQPVSVLARV